MDNIQKSVIFVLLTVGLVTLMLESAIYRSPKNPTPQASVPVVPAPATPQASEFDNADPDVIEEEEGKFGDPVLSTAPISDEEIASKDSESSSNAVGGAVNSNSTNNFGVANQGQSFIRDNQAASSGNSTAVSSGIPAIQGIKLPPAPPPIPGPRVVPPPG